MNSGSTSIARQSETHAPHWMHAIDWVTSTMLSRGTTYSRTGTGSLASSHGVTRPDLLPVDRLHVDDQVLDHRHVAHRLDLDHAVGTTGLARVQVGVAGKSAAHR